MGCYGCGARTPVINIIEKACKGTVSSTNWKQFNVSENIILTEANPNINSLVSLNISAKVLDYNLILTPDSINVENAEGTFLTCYKMIINGILNQTIVYESDAQGNMYTFKVFKEFSTFVIMDPNYDVTKIPCIDICIEDVMIDKLNEREILKNVALLVQVN